MPMLNVNGVAIYYEQHGRGESLVLIGGAGTDTSIWLAVLDDLAKNFRVTLFDNRGSGKSTTPHETLTTKLLAQDTMELMRALDIESAHVLGHSLGGAIAQQMALRYPERIQKLILCGTFAKLNPISRQVVKNSVDLYRAGTSPQMLYQQNIPWLYSSTFLADKQKMRSILEKNLKEKEPQAMEGMAKQGEACLLHDTTNTLKNIPHPTLVISADHDLMIPLEEAKKLTELLSNARLIVIDKTAHLFIIEKPKEFCDAVVSFLSSHSQC